MNPACVGFVGLPMSATYTPPLEHVGSFHEFRYAKSLNTPTSAICPSTIGPNGSIGSSLPTRSTLELEPGRCPAVVPCWASPASPEKMLVAEPLAPPPFVGYGARSDEFRLVGAAVAAAALTSGTRRDAAMAATKSRRKWVLLP